MPFWKLLLVPVAVLLVAMAYAAGALTGSPAAPSDLTPIVLQDTGGTTGSDDSGQGRPGSGTSEPTPEGTREPSPRAEDDDDDDDDDDDVRVVIPEPTEVDDREDDREDGGHDDREDDD